MGYTPLGMTDSHTAPFSKVDAVGRYTGLFYKTV